MGRAKLFEALEFGEGNMLFSLKEIAYTPEAPRKKEPFTVKGKVELFGIPFLAPIWIQVRVTYPERWWEEIIPIIGGPSIAEGAMVIGGDFEITFPGGFDREGEFILEVAAYAGPTYSIDKITLPPFPPVSSEETTFIVAGEVPPEEVGFRGFRIVSYSKNGGTPVEPPGVLELEVGDRCRVNVAFDHRNSRVTGEFHAAIWQDRVWDPHDEILNAEKAFSAPASTDWESWEGYIDIIVTSEIAPGTEYGLYVKIMGITGGDIFTEYLPNIITIIGPPGLDFELTKPTVSETPVDPGSTINIRCPITSNCTEPVAATAKLIIYEGSWLPGHGTKLKEYNSGVFHINPGETKEFVVENHTTVAGTIDRRDVEVEVYVEGRLIKESEWDDVYYVKEVELELLDVRIDPSGAGYVTVSPEPESGTEHNWYFPHGTVVNVTAHPYPGYVFESWSGEMTDTTAITAPVYPMTEKRTITAHFRKIEKEIDFVLAPPSVTPLTITPGTHITIVCPITSACNVPQTITAKVKIYEGSWLPGHGTLLDTKTSPAFTIAPGETYNVKVSRTAIAGTIDRRDVEVEVYISGRVVKEDEWDDVYYVVPGPPPPPPPVEEYTLEVTVEPPVSGLVGVYPRKAFYSVGEVVTLIATPYSGYVFDHWGGWPAYPGIESTLGTLDLTMDSNWWVVAVFKKAAPPGQCSLSVSVSPSSGGSVTVSPDKALYDDGEMIDVTAIANPGWSFDKFTGDGWETRANPVHVRGCLTTSVTAHFL